MDDLAERVEGTPLARTLRSVATQAREDQQLVRDVLVRLATGERRAGQAAAWMTEKVREGHLALMARQHPALAVLEGLESLALGLQGKLAMFRLLTDLAPADPRLADLPFAARAERTVDEHAAIEAERLAAAREAFATTPADRQ
jgi:hypothetical protein